MPLRNNPIFVLQGEAVALGAEGWRDGARHRVLLLISAADLSSASPRASRVALHFGFRHLMIKKADRLDITADDVEQDYLKSAIIKAQETGREMVVYDEELPPNT